MVSTPLTKSIQEAHFYRRATVKQMPSSLGNRSRNDIPSWLNFGANIIIIILTVEIVRLNRFNVYLNSRNVHLNARNVELNAEREARQPTEQHERTELLNEIKQINLKIEKGKC